MKIIIQCDKYNTDMNKMALTPKTCINTCNMLVTVLGARDTVISEKDVRATNTAEGVRVR